jgi:hypothetical protein
MGDKKGTVYEQPGTEVDIPSQLEDAKEVELGLVRGSAMYRIYVTCAV